MNKHLLFSPIFLLVFSFFAKLNRVMVEKLWRTYASIKD